MSILSMPLFKVTLLLGHPEHEPNDGRQRDWGKRKRTLHEKEDDALMEAEVCDVAAIVLNRGTDSSINELLDHCN